MREHPIQQRILLALSQGATRLFRVNTGTAWAGKGRMATKREMVTLEPGDAVVRRAQPVRMGLCNGGSDTIGWTTLTITPDMVGRQVAVFTGIEVKGDGGRVSADQANFIRQVALAGGIAGVAYSVDDARALVEGYRSSGER